MLTILDFLFMQLNKIEVYLNEKKMQYCQGASDL